MLPEVGFCIPPTHSSAAKGPPTAENVLAITVVAALPGNTSLQGASDNHTRTRRPRWGADRPTGIGVMQAVLDRVLPLGGLAIALIVTVAWIGLLGYAVSKLF